MRGFCLAAIAIALLALAALAGIAGGAVLGLCHLRGLPLGGPLACALNTCRKLTTSAAAIRLAGVPAMRSRGRKLGLLFLAGLFATGLLGSVPTVATSSPESIVVTCPHERYHSLC